MSTNKRNLGRKKPPSGKAESRSRRSSHGKGSEKRHVRDAAGRKSDVAVAHKANPKTPAGTYWLYGVHAVMAGLQNPNRQVQRLICNQAQRENLEKTPDFLNYVRLKNLEIEMNDSRNMGEQVGRDAVHQGIIALVSTLKTKPLEQFLQTQAATEKSAPIVVLDQVTDPHNVGAILRSAAAFGVAAIVVPKDHAAAETGAMAKAACGALELVPLLDVTNLARGLKQLKQAGYWLAGLDGEAKDTLHKRADLSPLALVLGAEGKGLRRLTADACDLLVKLPMDSRMESLNVSNAAAIALYQLYLQRDGA